MRAIVTFIGLTVTFPRISPVVLFAAMQDSWTIIQPTVRVIWQRYGVLVVALATLSLLVILIMFWIATSPEKAERVFSWFRLSRGQDVSSQDQLKSESEDPVLSPVLWQTTNSAQEQVLNRMNWNPTCVKAIQSAAGNYQQVHPELQVIIKRWTETGDKAVLAINTSKKSGVKNLPIMGATKRTYLTINEHVDILDID